MQKILLVAAVVSAVLPRVTVAQPSSALREGVRVEINPIHAKPQIGRLISLSSDSLLYARSGGAQTVSIPLTEIRSVKVSQGRSHLRGALKKGLLGAGLGIVAGGVIGAASWSEQSTDFFCRSRNACTAAGAMFGGGLGLIAGTLFGAAVGDERWATIDSWTPRSPR